MYVCVCVWEGVRVRAEGSEGTSVFVYNETNGPTKRSFMCAFEGPIDESRAQFRWK